jgi:diguanylate cyclase (GGDEF)-like protein
MGAPLTEAATVQLDPGSIILAGSAVLVIQGAAFLYFWARDRSAKWLAWWGVPFVVGGAGIALYAIPDWSTDIFNIAGGNLLRILSMWALWQGIRRFEGRSLVMWPGLAVAIGWLVFVTFPQTGSNLIARILVVSFLIALFCGLTAWELRPTGEPSLPSRRALMATFTSFAVLLMVRGVLAAIAPYPIGVLPPNAIWLAVFMLLVFGHFIFSASLFLAMTRERQEAQQRSFALSDPLTGLMNRRAFTDFAERMNRRRAGLRRGVSVMMLDLDHFKSINDRFGHDVGDRMLKLFATTAESSVRGTDELFRMGGEEFCFVLPETTAAEARIVAERIRTAFEEAMVQIDGGSASTTVSIGVAGTSFDVPIHALVAAADAAVYAAKARGRNCVVVADDAELAKSEPEALVFDRRRA